MITRNFIFTVFTVFMIAVHSLLSAQVPQMLNYQATARDDSGNLLKNTNLTVRMAILQDDVQVWQEDHDRSTNDLGHFNLKIGGPAAYNGSGSAVSFGNIDWSSGSYSLKVSVDNGSGFILLGTSELVSVPYALFAETAFPESAAQFQIIADEETNGEPLFQVLRNDGYPVFAVYEDAVWVYTDTADSGKGIKGGFAVGGYKQPSKGAQDTYMHVSADSIRMYIDDESSGKGIKGGFAVGGFNAPGKGSSSYMLLKPDNYFIGHESGQKLTSGIYNSTLGYQSGVNVSEGNANAFIGYQSGYYNTLGSGNLFLGYQTGFSNDVGNYNSFLGYLAGYSNVIGRFNTFLGSFSGFSNTDGSNNTFVGDSTGYNNIIGVENTFVGTGSGNKNVSGNSNVFIGNHAGYFVKTGTNNVFLGAYAGYHDLQSEDGSYANVFLGNGSGYNSVAGHANVMIGHRAGHSNVDSWNNVYIGNNSGFNSQTGGENVFIGNQSGYLNTESYSNVFIGNAAGYSNTTGGDNVFLGLSSGYSNTTGRENVYLGWNAGESSETTVGNVFVGPVAGKFTKGVLNVFVGMHTGENCVDGAKNTVVGAWAAADYDFGNENVILGDDAGRALSGERNVMLGTGAGSSNKGDANIFLGNWAGASEVNGSGKLYIENSAGDSADALIFGDFDTDHLRMNARVGIGGNAEGFEELYIEDPDYTSSIFLKGAGYADTYSQVILGSMEATGKLWQINHSMNNNEMSIVHFDGSDKLVNLTLQADGKLTVLKNGMDVGGSIDPLANNLYPLGSSTFHWKEVYVAEGVITTSDARMKEDIREIEYGLNELMKLDPISFSWKADADDDRKLGLIAQDVNGIVQEVVSVGDDENQTMGINYAELIPVLIKGIQEQQDEIEILKNEVASLKVQLEK